MRGLNALMVVLSVALLLVIGGGLMAHNFAVIEIGALTAEYGGSIWAVLAGAAMFLFGIIFIILSITARRPEKSFSVQNPEGEIRITFDAIEDMLKKSTMHIDGIEDIRPMVIEGKDGLEILSRVSVSEEVSIPHITASIQDVIKSQVRDVLGIDDMGAVRIYIYKIVSKSKPKAADKKDDKARG